MRDIYKRESDNRRVTKERVTRDRVCVTREREKDRERDREREREREREWNRWGETEVFFGFLRLANVINDES